jgi:carbonic anhydrase
MASNRPAEDQQHPACGRGGPLDDLIARNRAWVRRKTESDPRFFERLVGQQRPAYFWIGCSDSRVPATEIVDLDPGEMFVHRNVANLAPAGDANFNAALKFAVDELRVRHVIVVGHYGCGGIRAATDTMADDPVGRWLSPVRALYRRHRSSSRSIHDGGSCEDRLCELNVIDQVGGLSSNPIIASAWAQGRGPTIHGLVYAIGDGLIGSVCDAVLPPQARTQSLRVPRRHPKTLRSSLT